MTTVRADISRLELPRCLVTALRARELYPPDHPLVRQQMTALCDTLRQLLVGHDTLVIGVVGGKLIVDSEPIAVGADLLNRLLPQLQQAGIERICFKTGVTRPELDKLVDCIVSPAADTMPPAPGTRDLPHVMVDRIRSTTHTGTSATAMATAQRAYGTALKAAEQAWESASGEGVPDIGVATSAVAELAEMVASHRPALLALTAVQQFHGDTFNHMVNVAVLTLAQARTLGIDRPLLDEIGVAAMMHDIGKVRTPPEILTKPAALTPDELVIMQQHVVDGAEMLRQMADVPPLAPIVAFEHHLRPNGTGYPSVTRYPLNLATRLCSIADVYDAMRMKRDYQDALPSDRILAILERNADGEFDPDLVRRFVQLMGMYPPGTLVRLSTEEIAVILKAHAPDPYAPVVKVIRGSDGRPSAEPEVRSLWKHRADQADQADGSSHRDEPVTVAMPIDPAVYEIDPLQYL